jgi:hypothetical protein
MLVTAKVKILAQLPARRVGPTARREDQVFCDKIKKLGASNEIAFN